MGSSPRRNGEARYGRIRSNAAARSRADSTARLHPRPAATAAAPRRNQRSDKVSDPFDLSYKPTPDLPDDEARALLKHLETLWAEIDRAFSDKKLKRIRNSLAPLRQDETTLRKALLDAAVRFSTHENFTTWLCRNHCEHIEAYDPLRMTNEVLDAIHELRWKMQCLEDNMEGVDKIIKALVEERLSKPKQQE
jgi:hypothetical protein